MTALAELIKAHRYRQCEVVRAARSLGSNITPPVLSKLLSNTEPMTEYRAQELQAALLHLGFKKKDVVAALRSALAVI